MVERNTFLSSSSPANPPPAPPHQQYLHHSYDDPPQRYSNDPCPSPILPTYEETIQPGRHGHVVDVEQTPQGPSQEKPSKERQRRQRILSYLCCICCPCFPMWTRYLCCFLMFAIVVFAITAGILVALFQMPTVTFNGPTNHPEGLPGFQNLAGNTSTLGAFNINLGLNFTIANPNVEGLVFDKIKAIAYYPLLPNRILGGGNMTNLHINPGSTTQFIFPFQLHYDPGLDPGYAILFDMMTKCGLLGSPQKKDLVVNYDLKPTVRIIGVPVSPTIHQSASFPCPVQSGQFTMPQGLLSLMPSS